jgi:sugar lactone lactonase YvrE
LGQPSLANNSVNYGGISATSLNNPQGVTGCGTKLIVTDYDNNRVLVWNTIPTTNGQAADLVLGQPNMSSTLSRNSGPTNSSLSYPGRVHSDGTRLFVADANNNRVLVWNTIPTTNGQAASFALGQPNTTSNTFNNGGLSASRMGNPGGVYSDGTRLFVADTSNHRILVWNAIPTSSGQAADFALGQPNLTSNTLNNGGVSGSSLSFPYSVFAMGTKLFVGDSNNHRVLVWNSLPTTSGQLASFALGQPDLTSNTSNNGGISASTLNFPISIFSDGTKLFVADTSNHRIMAWNTIPTTNGQAADFLIGQPTFASNTVNNGGLSAASLSSPRGLFGDPTHFYISDSNNNRILVYPIPGL